MDDSGEGAESEGLEPPGAVRARPAEQSAG